MPRPVRITGAKGRRATGALVKAPGRAPAAFRGKKLTPPKIQIVVHGAKQAEKVFKLINKASKSWTQKGVEATLKMFLKQAQANVLSNPQLRAYDKGNLYKDLKYKIEVVKDGFVQGSAGNWGEQATGGTNPAYVTYHIYVHEGTRKMPKRPYLHYAYLWKVNLAIKHLEKSIQKDAIEGSAPRIGIANRLAR